MCKHKRNLFATKRYAVWAQTTVDGHNEHVQAKCAHKCTCKQGNLLTSPEKVSLVQRISANRNNTGVLLNQKVIIPNHDLTRLHCETIMPDRGHTRPQPSATLNTTEQDACVRRVSAADLVGAVYDAPPPSALQPFA